MANRDRWAMRFYWLGVVMTLASITLVLFGNTSWFSGVEHTNFPLAWKFAIVAVLAFLAGEICRPAFLFHASTDQKSSRDSLDHIPYEI